MKLLLVVILSGFLFSNSLVLLAQRDVRIMFYNTENLFDTENDPKINDDDFTPKGNLYWSLKRYNAKLQNLYKVITAVGEWSPPEIVAFCEVENRRVISDLILKTPLSETAYKIVHFDSPDNRGIDVALIYNNDKLTVIQEKSVPVKFPEKFENHKTRNILLAKFVFNKTDTFFVCVNHWPSRRGGELQSDDLRCFAAQTLKTQTDSIFKQNSKAKIVIVGDFNDEPTDASLTKCLQAIPSFSKANQGKLYNLSTNFVKTHSTGTHKFQGKWSVFDQVIVSGGLLLSSKGLKTNTENAKVFNAQFLLFPDKRNFGFMPNRTYVGMKYAGGYSDHLPVYIDLLIKK